MTSSHREALPTLPTPARYHRPAAFGSHANSEAVRFLPSSSVWLECPLHDSFTLTLHLTPSGDSALNARPND